MKSNLLFGGLTDLTLAATPSIGGHIVAYDSATGFLSQKNDQGIVSRIGVAATASGVLETFDADILVSLPSGKTFGRYVNGDVVPALGKTAVEVIIDALKQEIVPTVSLNSATTILFNQTAISNVLTYTYSINSLGATVSSTSLQWRRNNTGSWTTLSTNANLSVFTHSLTDTAFNTQPFNYRYVVTDSQSASNTATKDIIPGSYLTPSITLNVVAVTQSSIETNAKREKGNIQSKVSGLITRNSTNVLLNNYQLQYQKASGPWTNIGATVSISGVTASIALITHNDIFNLSDADAISYRVQVTDLYQTTTSNRSLVELFNVIFYGPVGSTPSNSSAVRALSGKVFTDNANPFNLNTGVTYSTFTVAMPASLNITEVLDLDALNANITGSYLLNTFNVLDFIGTNVSYHIYTMTNAIPYTANHRHQITR